LHKFIEENGCEIAGTHEEEYLTCPDAKVVKPLIRYPIKKK
jgi:effector-binding domain-containing protein